MDRSISLNQLLEQYRDHEQMIHSLNGLLEIAKTGIGSKTSLEVMLLWETDSYVTAINDVVDDEVIKEISKKSGIAVTNIADLNPNDIIGVYVDPESFWNAIDHIVTKFNVLPEEIGSLNPVELTALIIYTQQERKKQGEISQIEYIQSLGDALDRYKTIYCLADISFPQGDEPLRLFRETYPFIVENSGYEPIPDYLINLAAEIAQDLGFRLYPKEIDAITLNIFTKDKDSGYSSSEIIPRFKTWDGLQTYFYVGDEEREEQIKEIVWRSVPRLIIKKGYTRYWKGDYPLTDAELEINGGIEGLVEKFENTSENDEIYEEIYGGSYFILPGMESEVGNYEKDLQREQISARRQERRRIQREAREEQVPDNYVPPKDEVKPELKIPEVDTPETKPVDEELVSRIKRIYNEGQYKNVQDRVNGIPGRNLTPELDFYGISSSYHLAFRPLSKRWTINKVRNTIQSATDKYISLMQNNPELATQFEAELIRDINYGEDFIRNLPRNRRTDSTILMLENKFGELKTYAPQYEQPQSSGSLFGKFFNFLRR